MPEGPEVKTVARTLDEKLGGLSLGALWHSDYKLRRYVDYSELRKLERSQISSVSCYGKVLFLNIQEKPAIFAQLGMTGQLRVEEKEAPVQAHTHVRWELLESPYELRYVDPRRFGLFDICSEKAQKEIINKLGPDPFSLKLGDTAALSKNMRTSSRAIKEVLLDQKIIAGVGNIYASEALFRARIRPDKRACDIQEKDYDLLIQAIIHVMNQAYENCGTTFSNYVDGSGTKGKNLDFLQVFQRESQACLVCKTPIQRIKQGGRSTFFCAACQK
jgi:formamidopyrimidine-DNA glycosylase